MSTEAMLWTVLAAIGVVGGIGLLSCLWALLKAPKQY